MKPKFRIDTMMKDGRVLEGRIIGDGLLIEPDIWWLIRGDTRVQGVSPGISILRVLETTE